MLKKKKKQIEHAIIHINSALNNTIFSVSDLKGNVICWASAGSFGYRGAKKKTVTTALQTAKKIIEMLRILFVRQCKIYVRGELAGIEEVLLSFFMAKLRITALRFYVKNAFNGCRPPKLRKL